LVGGSVRDALLERSADYLDLDFVLPDQAVETAKAIAHRYHAGFVLLDAERQIARVVFDQATADFAQQVGPDLESDLRRRDFTINAIAYHPHTQTLIDPLHGHDDLEQKLIRMVSQENLEDDPLRLLRAYRQASQLGFSVESRTRATIQALNHLLQRVAPERVQAEISYLLSSPEGTPMLALAWQDGLLNDWLPHVTAKRLQQVAQVDWAADAIAHKIPQFESVLQGWLRDRQKTAAYGRSWLKVAKLTQLISPDCEQAEQELWRLKYSRAEVQAVLALLRIMPQLEANTLPYLSNRDYYFFFQAIGASFPAAAVLAVAHGTPLDAIAPLIKRFLTPNDPIAHPSPPISGRDLMKRLRLIPGPQVGQLLDAILIAQAEGKVTSAEEALAFAQAQLGQQR
jgi:tRNA nucleotidyltransferase (CCA-adding enzyme)